MKEETLHTWEKTFDEFYNEQWYKTRNGHSCIGRLTLRDILKEHITSLLTLSRQQTLDEAIGALPDKTREAKNQKEIRPDGNLERKYTWNKYRQSALTALNELKKKSV